MGTVGSLIVLALAVGVCYYSGLLDFAGGEREALSSSVRAAGFPEAVKREMDSIVQKPADQEGELEEPAQAEAEAPPESEEVQEEGIRLLFAGDLYLTEV